MEIVGKVAIGTAMGLSYLHGHSPPIIHRDLKSANLLLDESFNVKVYVEHLQNKSRILNISLHSDM